MEKETKLLAAFKDLNKEMRKVRFCSTGISSFLITCVGVKLELVRRIYCW
jgi:hypothetical protein